MRSGSAIALITISIVGCGDGDDVTNKVPSVEDDSLPGGIPEGMCAAGFVHDGVAGCEPILPPQPCPVGLMAVPGESDCREIASCGEGTWGDIVFDAATQHVDQTFTGVSDGTINAPWVTIGDAVSAVASGGLVAVAAGSYLEDLDIAGKSLRLQGVCPQQVELVGTGNALAAVDVRTGASGTELRAVAIVGGPIGVLLSGSQNVLLEQVWVHDNAGRGVDVESALGPTSCTVRASLFEHNRLTGVFSAGAEISVEASVVRDTLATAPFGGRGITAQPEQFDGTAALLSVRGSLLERNVQAGAHISGSTAIIEATVVRDTQSDTAGIGGAGVTVQQWLDTGAPAFATVHSSLLERNRSVAVFVAGAELTVETTVVRDTLADAQGRFGRGVGVQSLTETDGPGRATLAHSLIARNTGFGVFVAGGDASINNCLITGTLQNNDGLYGDAVLTEFAGLASSTFVEASGIDGSARAGVATFGSVVSIGNSALRCNAFDLAGELHNGQDFAFENRGGNLCGCPMSDEECTLVSTGLKPPQPIPP
jgi:hypothetical protein